jgi:hypothetical protein
VNDSFFLFVKASGSSISYQWYRNGTPVAAAIKDTLTFNGISLDNNGDTIHCIVKNILGTSVSSKKILLTVKDTEGAKITAEPSGVSDRYNGGCFLHFHNDDWKRSDKIVMVQKMPCSNQNVLVLCKVFSQNINVAGRFRIYRVL